MPNVWVKTVELPPVDEREALRYARAGEESRPILKRCQEGVEFTPRVVYTALERDAFFAVLPSARGSMSLTKLLDGCERVVVFVATVGVAFDYALERRQYVSLAEAQILEGLGTERIEALCDVFCGEWENATRRFSPGYGDLSLEAQREIFRALNPSKIGVSLTESLMMTPSKSVTAIFGIRA